MSNFIPDGWAEYKIKDTANINDRYSFTGGPFGSDLKSEDYTANGVRIIQLQNIGDGVFKNKYKIYTSEEKADALHSCNIYPNDIILSKMGDPVARAVIMPNLSPRYVMASDGIRLAINRGKFDTKFIHDTINSVPFRNQAELNSTGSTRKRIGLTQLRELIFIAPPLPEQQKIAAILTSVDDVIEKTQAQIDKLKDLKTGMMQELLTRGVGVDGKPHTEFKDSPVGRIPKGWGVVTMREICVTRQGLQIPISNRYSEPAENRFVYLTIKFINTGFNPAVAQYIQDPSERVICNEDDIILARTGATGKVVTGVSGVFHNNFFMVDYNRSKIKRSYLVQYLNSPFIQNEIKNRAGTTTIPDLNHGDFYSMPMLIPSMHEQSKIADALESNDNLILNKTLKLNALIATKKALMQDLLTGRVRVKVDS